MPRLTHISRKEDRVIYRGNVLKIAFTETPWKREQQEKFNLILKSVSSIIFFFLKGIMTYFSPLFFFLQIHKNCLSTLYHIQSFWIFYIFSAVIRNNSIILFLYLNILIKNFLFFIVYSQMVFENKSLLLYIAYTLSGSSIYSLQ